MSTHTLISPKPAAATIKVNGVVITPEAVAAEAQHHPSTRPEAAWKAAAEALVIKEALLQSARHHNVEIGAGKSEDGVETTEEDQLIESYLDSKVTTPEPSEEESRRYYENNRAKLRSPDIFEPSHILLQADPEDEPAFNRARNEAEALIEHLQRRPGKFERMARDRSDCTSSTEGGHLGQVSTGQTTPAFESAMRNLKPGQLSDRPVETPYGFHVLRLDQYQAGSIPDFEQARPLVEEFLRDASWRRAVAQFVSLVVGEAKIEGVELSGATTPLVQ